MFDGNMKDGVILGADTRETEGPIVADKNCEKIHYMAPDIYCCGAGTAANTEAVTDMVSSQLRLHRFQTGHYCFDPSQETPFQYRFSYQGHVSAALVLGGVDITGPHLHTIYPHGSTDTQPFATMGSGSLAAMSVFEAKYKEGLTLVALAICSGIFNDLRSGSNVDLCDHKAKAIHSPRKLRFCSPKSRHLSGRVEVVVEVAGEEAMEE
ncbi:unnamed protein product [Thlaspi arvense]|uniref:Proteasome endopeptidase complex n=1 Tax=Thlaspi arvense TaxID=13288 RepID=A0AAU9RQF3_THLAR|nr:unnamed protein product [Thlaspi arvense]